MNKHVYIRFTLFLLIMGLIGCGGSSYEKERQEAKVRQQKQEKQNAEALKIGTLPTLDCLPFYVAMEEELFDTAAHIRINGFDSQIDADAALMKKKIEGCVTDIVRAQRMISKGIPVHYLTTTNAYWQLISSRSARLTQLKQLEDKMIAMTRYSVTDYLSDLAVDSAKLKQDMVFRVQINDPNVRMKMLLNKEMDAVLLTEPQATTARLYKNPVLMDSRNKQLRMGAVVVREELMKNKRRQEQIEALVKGYNAACDSINKKGVAHYATLVKQFTKTDDRTIKALPKITFHRAEAPTEKDLSKADKWLK